MAVTVELGAFVVPDASDVDGVLAQVQAVEDGGLDLVGIQDHPYQRRFLDTFSLLAFLAGADVARPAAAGRRLAAAPPPGDDRQGGGVDRRAERRAVRARARRGRVLGGDRGVRRAEPVGAPESVDALEEAIAILRACWSGERSVTFEGEHYRVRGMKFGPPPAHPIGIWLGAYGPRMMRVVAGSPTGGCLRCRGWPSTRSASACG